MNANPLLSDAIKDAVQQQFLPPFGSCMVFFISSHN